jgi:NAD(P)-dependent dehydrogenase (short-subunit alcohol dehydrogenase family)
MLTPFTALIVGGTSGIGLATARQLVTLGGNVHVAGRSAEKLGQLAADNPTLVGHQVDGGDRAEVGLLAASIAPIDALVVTLSGAEGIGPLADLDLAMLRRAFEAKFWAHLTTIQAALPHLAENGSITLVSAISARASMPGTAGVGAINAAVEGLIKPLAVELAPIRVNAVSPGLVDTPWWNGKPEANTRAYFAAAAKMLPARQIASADDIAQAIVLLATNPNITGTIIESDAGARLVSI